MLVKGAIGVHMTDMVRFAHVSTYPPSLYIEKAWISALQNNVTGSYI